MMRFYEFSCCFRKYFLSRKAGRKLFHLPRSIKSFQIRNSYTHGFASRRGEKKYTLRGRVEQTRGGSVCVLKSSNRELFLCLQRLKCAQRICYFDLSREKKKFYFVLFKQKLWYVYCWNFKCARQRKSTSGYVLTGVTWLKLIKFLWTQKNNF